MPKKKYYDTSKIAELEAIIKSTKSVYEYKKAQSLLIPMKLSIKLEEVAKILNVSNRNIHRMRARKMKEMENSGVKYNTHGGRRNQNMLIEEERLILADQESNASIGAHVDSFTIKQSYEQKLGRTVHLSVITRMLARHGWVKLAPRKYHPKKNAEAQEIFKKNLFK